MSELNDFALKVASLLDTIADAPPETSSIPGVPYHMTLLESAKLAKIKHAAMKKEALTGLEIGGLMGLGGLGAAGLAGLKNLGGKAWQALGQRAAQSAEQRAAQEIGEAAGKVFAPGRHLDDLRAAMQASVTGMGAKVGPEQLQKELGEMMGGTMVPASKLLSQTQKHEKAISDLYSKGLMGAGLGLGGLYAGSQMARPNQQSNLPQIVRYG